MVRVDQPELWRDLYVMLGTSSAGLIGLLFIASSLHLEEMKNDVFRLRASNNTLCLLTMLIQAAAILVPQATTALGVELTATNLIGLMIPLHFTYKVQIRDKSLGRRGGYSLYRAIGYIAGYLIGVAGGIALINLSAWGMYFITLSYICVIAAVIWNAWMIMFGLQPTTRAK
jgi:hypothetical protein